MDQLFNELFDCPVEPSSHECFTSQTHHRIQSSDGASRVEPAIDSDPLAGDAEDNTVERTVANALAGGTISELTGGKFVNGSITAALQMATEGAISEADKTCAEGNGTLYPEDPKKAALAVEESNMALLKAGFYNHGYTTEQELANTWGDIVYPISQSLQVEIGADIYFDSRSNLYFGAPGSSSGAVNHINVSDYSTLGFGHWSAYVHTHPSEAGWNPTFSIPDYQVAYGYNVNAYVISRDYRYQWNFHEYMNFHSNEMSDYQAGFPRPYPYDVVRHKL